MNTETQTAMKVIRRRRRVERRRRWEIYRWEFDPDSIKKRQERMLDAFKRNMEIDLKQQAKNISNPKPSMLQKIINPIENLWKMKSAKS